MRALKMGIHASSFMRHGLIGYWPLNERSLARDQSGAGNNGTVDGAIFNDNYAQFDGLDDRITLPSPYTTEILSNSTKTMSIWAFLLGEDQGEGQRFFTFTFTTTTTAFEIGAGLVPPSFRFRYRTTSAPSEIGNIDITAFLNAWHHLVFVQNNSNVLAYIDGELVDSASDAGLPTPSSPANATIGGSNSFQESINGRLKFARLYNRALSANEIQTLFNFERNL